MSQSGPANLANRYAAGSGILLTNPLEPVLSGFDCAPNQVTISADSDSTTYAILGSAGGQRVSIGGVVSGVDRDYPAGSPLSFLLVGSASGLTLTTDGSSGPATLIGSVLNIPQYSGGGGYTAPTFTAFSISGQSSPIEVGATLAGGSRTFVWSTSTPSNIEANTLAIADTTTSTVLASGLANDGTEAISISGVTRTTAGTHTWTISGTDTQSDPFSRAYSVSWRWRVWVGGSALPELDDTGVQSLAASALQTAIAGTYTIVTAGYKYVAMPTSFAAPLTFKDDDTGFNVPMCTTANDAAFSGTDTNGNNYLPVTLVNANSVSQAYAVYRTQNSLGGSLALRIT